MFEVKKWNGLDAVYVSNEFAEAVVTLNGAHTVSYIPSGKKDLLWISKSSNFTEGKAIRGGIPLCWPWFGPALQPTHGYARISRWTFECSEETANGTVLHFFLKPYEAEFAHLSAEMKILVGRVLTVSLTTVNNGTGDFVLTDALHTYFDIVDIHQVAVAGFENVDYIDRLDNDLCKKQQGPITISCETDRIYQTGADAVISDGVRKIRVSRTGSQSSVVWNPWIEKSKKMQDFGDNEYTGMICVEATNAGKDVITLKPGTSHTLSTTIELL